MEHILIGVCLLFFAWAAYLFCRAAYQSVYLHYWGFATTGKIVELIRNEDKGEDGGITYQPVVAFTMKEGVQVQVKSSFGSQEAASFFHVGEQVGIRYSPKDPTVFAIDGLG